MEILQSGTFQIVKDLALFKRWRLNFVLQVVSSEAVPWLF